MEKVRDVSGVELPPSANNLPYVIFCSTGIEEGKHSIKISTPEKLPFPRKVPPHTTMTRQDDA
jgi:hypothetical protein